jgi:GTP-binding protein
MFVDVAKIEVRAGAGGDGMVAYRREKYVPLGGPAGGDGGRGGDVVLEVDEGLRTLLDFRYQRHLRADSGGKGGPKNRHGADAADLVVKVPPGTRAKDAQSGVLLADLTEPGSRAVIAKGGRGGRGNAHFATGRNKAPDNAERGEPGQERTVLLELQVIADVGLVGLPSVGKSTLLAAVSAARPKTAAYHFTTIAPHLGVVSVGEEGSFVLADLPGLIEGAHQGAGLGHEFLRHVMRTRMLIHVIDMGGEEGRDPVADYEAINLELELYDPTLPGRAQIVAANKMDLPDAQERLQRFADAYPQLEVWPISALAHDGTERLMQRAAQLLATIAPPVAQDASAEEHSVRMRPGRLAFVVTREQDGFAVTGDDLHKLVAMTNFEQDDAVKRFARIMRYAGVDDALRKAGARQGDTVRVGDLLFDFVE